VATKAILDPESGLEREYAAVVAGRVDEPALRAALLAGVDTALGAFSGDLMGSTAIEDPEVADTQHTFPWVSSFYLLQLFDSSVGTKPCLFLYSRLSPN
jgi:hypothetical protein